jgi:hypothetical protein
VFLSREWNTKTTMLQRFARASKWCVVSGLARLKTFAIGAMLPAVGPVRKLLGRKLGFGETVPRKTAEIFGGTTATFLDFRWLPGPQNKNNAPRVGNAACGVGHFKLIARRV